MKRSLSTSICTAICALVAGALACGCGAGTQAAPAPVAPTPSTTQLMFADVSSSTSRPAPKVGKAHLVLGEDLDGPDAPSTREPSADADELRAPKEARRSDGSRRGGHFGTTK
jgi:hypothetical protein